VILFRPKPGKIMNLHTSTEPCPLSRTTKAFISAVRYFYTAFHLNVLTVTDLIFETHTHIYLLLSSTAVIGEPLFYRLQAFLVSRPTASRQ